MGGYPVVKVQRDYASGGAMADQDRFLLTPANPQHLLQDNASYTWWVPISWTTPELGFDTTYPSAWLDPARAGTDTALSLSGLEATQPLIVNVQQTGFYRVNYDLENWNLLADQLIDNHTSINRVNRAQIIDDALNLARAGLLDYPIALRQTEYLSLEVDYIPWKAAFNGFKYLENMLKRSPGWGDLRSYLATALQPLLNKLGFEERPGEDFLSEKLRISLLAALCGQGNQQCTEFSIYLLDEWMSYPDPDSSSPIPTSLQSTLLCTGIAAGNLTHWDFLWQRYLNSNNANEKAKIMGALACTKEIWLLQRYLDMALDENSGVRKQDGYRVVTGVSKNTVGRYLAWNWLRQNWSRISQYYDTAISSAVGRMITAVAADFNTEFELAELEAFIAEHENELGSAGRSAKQMVESTKANIAWTANHYQTIVDWLQTQLTRLEAD